jgi:hypothetical protein
MNFMAGWPWFAQIIAWIVIVLIVVFLFREIALPLINQLK